MAERCRVKICGLRRREDAETAAAAGADYLGVVLTPGFGRSVEASHAAGLVRGLPATPVAVLVDESPARAERLGRTLGAGVLQLHGEETPAAVRAAGDAGPWEVWKAVRVREAADVGRAVAEYAELVDGLLVEGWREGVVGGVGVSVASDALDSLRESVPSGILLIVAGGLTPASVGRVVARVRPDVVDVSSGVESAPEGKDPGLVRRFVSEVRRVDRAGVARSADGAAVWGAEEAEDDG